VADLMTKLIFANLYHFTWLPPTCSSSIKLGTGPFFLYLLSIFLSIATSNNQEKKKQEANSQQSDARKREKAYST
jgi:hypothetical protein